MSERLNKYILPIYIIEGSLIGGVGKVALVERGEKSEIQKKKQKTSSYTHHGTHWISAFSLNTSHSTLR